MSLSATRFKEQIVKTTIESLDDRLALKPWNVYNSWKKDSPTNEENTKIPLFAVIFSSLDVLIWISAKVKHKFLPS